MNAATVALLVDATLTLLAKIYAIAKKEGIEAPSWSQLQVSIGDKIAEIEAERQGQ